jgi:hypothetical protein
MGIGIGIGIAIAIAIAIGIGMGMGMGVSIGIGISINVAVGEGMDTACIQLCARPRITMLRISYPHARATLSRGSQIRHRPQRGVVQIPDPSPPTARRGSDPRSVTAHSEAWFRSQIRHLAVAVQLGHVIGEEDPVIARCLEDPIELQ